MSRIPAVFPLLSKATFTLSFRIISVYLYYHNLCIPSTCFLINCLLNISTLLIHSHCVSKPSSQHSRMQSTRKLSFYSSSFTHVFISNSFAVVSVVLNFQIINRMHIQSSFLNTCHKPMFFLDTTPLVQFTPRRTSGKSSQLDLILYPQCTRQCSSCLISLIHSLYHVPCTSSIRATFCAKCVKQSTYSNGLPSSIAFIRPLSTYQEHLVKFCVYSNKLAHQSHNISKSAINQCCIAVCCQLRKFDVFSSCKRKQCSYIK